MNTLGVVFLILTFLLLIIPVVLAIYYTNVRILIFSGLSFLSFVLFWDVNYPEPSSNNIKDGKAEYIKEDHIITNEQGDTINTYSTYTLKWKDGWKYGRKQHALSL